MFTKDEIFARLMNGESMDAIMAEMNSIAKAAAVEAEQAREAQKKLEEEKKAKAEAIKLELADATADGINKLMALACPEVVEKLGEKSIVTGKMLLDTIEGSAAAIMSVFPMIEQLEKTCSCGCCEGDHDPIQAFIDNGFRF